jgi:apolipoprotein N-acyltransferase
MAVWMRPWLLLLGGVLHAFSMAWPLPFGWQTGQTVWYLQVLALALLFGCLLQARSMRHAAGYGGLFACAAMCATFWWLFVAMHTYAGLPVWLAAFAVWGLAAPLSLYYALAAAGFWYCRQLPLWAGCLCAGAVWMLADMARGIWLTGFGWGASGYAHVDGPLAWFAPWVGVYGVGALAAIVSCFMAFVLLHAVRQRHASPGVVVAVLALCALLWLLQSFPTRWTQSNGSVSVALLQGNIPQDEKFETGSGVPLALQWYQAQLHATTADLVVAPETAIPLLPQQLPPDYWSGLIERFASGQQAALVGIPLGNPLQGYTNAVVGLGGNLDVWQYHKHHLVPFGEFIPPFFKWFTRMMNIPLGDFERGGLGQPSFAVLGQRLAPNICYEDLFGEELAQRFTEPALAPTVFVNVSNMGWFGDNASVYQHLHISRMRALELERPFVRATNTGATVIIDHHAQVVAALPHYVRDVLHGTVEGRNGITPYAWWTSRWGLWPLWLLGGLAVLLLTLRSHSLCSVARS